MDIVGTQILERGNEVDHVLVSFDVVRGDALGMQTYVIQKLGSNFLTNTVIFLELLLHFLQ